MKTFLITAAAAASTLAIAAPAAAQWAPPPPPAYGYNNGAPYGNAYGYQNNYGQARSMQARVDQLQRRIVQLDRRNVLSNREARRLLNESTALERRIAQSSYNGVNYREMREIEVRIARLEQRIYREANDGDRRLGQNQYGQYGQYSYDRDRDGRDDRYEDDRGRIRD